MGPINMVEEDRNIKNYSMCNTVQPINLYNSRMMDLIVYYCDTTKRVNELQGIKKDENIEDCSVGPLGPMKHA